MRNLKKKKLFGIFNIVDILIILIIIVIASGVYIKFYTGEEDGAFDTKSIKYVAEFTLKSKDFVDTISIGDEIRDSIKGGYLGKIVDIEIKKSYKIVKNTKKGEFVNSIVPDNFDAIITIEATGRVTSESIFAEGTEIKVGKKMFLKGKGYASQCFIVRIDY